jgi:antitoxin component YwqK of YwqJK toxin-antitoxin module
MESNYFEGKIFLRKDRKYYHGKFFETESKMHLKYEGKCGPCGKYGFGVQYENNEKIFEGLFRDNTRHGHGVLYSRQNTNGNNDYRIYDGQWKLGKRHGRGTSWDEGRKVYEGDWRDDIRTGLGSQFAFNGQLEYHGNFHNNRRHGKGTLYFEDQSNYLQGDFRNDRCNGKATLYINHSKCFEGFFRHGYPNGNGTLYYENEMPYFEGKWNNGHSCAGGKKFNRDGSCILNSRVGSFHVPIVSSSENNIEVIRGEMNIRNYLETSNNEKIKHISDQQLLDYLSKNYKVLDTSLDRENLLWTLKENYNKNKKQNMKEDEFDLFGNKIVIPCFGNDNQIYDLLSMEYLFLQNDENDYVNIPYVYDNNIRVPNFPIMEGGHRLTSYFCPTLEYSS